MVRGILSKTKGCRMTVGLSSLKQTWPLLRSQHEHPQCSRGHLSQIVLRCPCVSVRVLLTTKCYIGLRVPSHCHAKNVHRHWIFCDVCPWDANQDQQTVLPWPRDLDFWPLICANSWYAEISGDDIFKGFEYCDYWPVIVHFTPEFLPECDYVTFGSLLSQIRLSSVRGL